MNDARPPLAPPAEASMTDMLRIMDVASALRRERETAEAVLDADTAKARLREKLLATAAAAGETVTPAEVDAAIDAWFRQQHVYADPPASWGRFWANVWVARRLLLLVGGGIAAATGLILWVAFAMANAVQPAPKRAPVPQQPAATAPAVAPAVAPVPAPVPAPQPAVDPLPGVWAAFQRSLAAVQALAADDDARQRVAKIAALGEAANGAHDLARLRTAATDLATLAARLDEEYVVTIVSRPGEKSGVDRYQDGRLSGYYLIVEAVTPGGERLPRSIRNAETQRTETVKAWGELVPEAVWNRVVADKQKDGVVDDAEFARKVRGVFAETTTIQGGDGSPLRRGRQITRW